MHCKHPLKIKKKEVWDALGDLWDTGQLPRTPKLARAYIRLIAIQNYDEFGVPGGSSERKSSVSHKNQQVRARSIDSQASWNSNLAEAKARF